ncbi:MAG: pitrilysin family protein [Robiginitomaculum sp.]
MTGFKLNLMIGAACAALALSACSPSTSAPDVAASKTSVSFEKYTLPNGLDVILHVDKSDPVVAIDLAVHVGSARETTGRTGFAHLFEHLLFLDSENLGYGGLDEMNTRIGGEGTNGFTTHDMTQYFQAVPSDGLEKIIWAEADKLGYFIETVSQNVIDKEKQVVKNEKRQRVDNRAGGHNFYVINKALYPESHPYNWQVIGSLSDLDAASLEDVKNFYRRWYVPNNVTLTLAGDFDKAEAKAMIAKYFGEIPAGEAVENFAPLPPTLNASLSVYHEDNFATAADLTMVWPAVEQYHPDSYALNMLAEYLTEGKRAPINEVLIDEDKVTTSVGAFYYGKEIAGEFYLSVTANEGEDIDDLMPSIDKAFARFESHGISEADVARIKAGLEVEFYDSSQSVLGKAIQLGEYNVFTGDPGFYGRDIANIRTVTPADIMRVYNHYIKDKPRLYTSFVPKGQLELKLDDTLTPQKAHVVEEVVTQGAEKDIDFDPAARIIKTPTASSFDRTQEPSFGPAITVPAPVIWRGALSNGIALIGTYSNETPLVNFSLKIDAGDARADINAPAIPTFAAAMLEKGTAHKTTAELEDAIKSLGSTISIYSNQGGAYVSGTTLSRNFDATMELLTQMLTEPRWDSDEFDTMLRGAINTVDQQAASAGAIARREFAGVLYPADNIYSVYNYGAKDKLEVVTLEQVKVFHASNFTPKGATLRIAGDIKAPQIRKALAKLEASWTGKDNAKLDIAPAIAPAASKVYFYDMPGAKQSVLRFGYPALSARHPDYFKAEAMNYLLGNIYTSKLNTELRVNKGYTYGIGSSFNGHKNRGEFMIASNVRTNVTLESAQLIKGILAGYGEGFSADDLATLKSALIKGQALKSETLDSKLGLLSEISTYGYSDDFKAVAAKQVEALTLTDIQTLAKTYLRPNQMHYVFVGDAESQAERLSALGFGAPIMLGEDK